MKGMTRREFHELALAGAASPGFPGGRGGGDRPDSRVRGVQIGVQSYSFRDRPLDAAIAGMRAVGLSSCELWQGHVEPKTTRGDAEGRKRLRDWRLTVPLDDFRTIRRKFDDAGIDLYAYTLSFRDDFTDAEMERGFEMAKALGVRVMTGSATVSAAKRIDGFARRHRMRVGMHGHDNVADPNEFSSPETFARAMAGSSEFLCVNLDIGHFTAAGFDAVDYLTRHHDRIVTLHIKDRKRNTPGHEGANVPFGQGDTPIKAVLGLLRERRWAIPANIEYEYAGVETVAEVRACYDYCRKALA